jgi:CBS domain containing-hemolysin-like protein
MDSLGRIPQVGDAVEIEGIHLRVEAVDHHSATEVCVSLPSGEMA